MDKGEQKPRQFDLRAAHTFLPLQTLIGCGIMNSSFSWGALWLQDRFAMANQWL
jgi:hypothetical protein